MKESANQWSDWSRALYNVLYFAKFLYVSCDMYRLLVGIEINNNRLLEYLSIGTIL